MVNYEIAKGLAEEHINFLQLMYNGLVLVLLEDETIEKPFGWIFFYNSKEYLETGNLSLSLAGNAPFIIDRDTGKVYLTGTAHPLEYYINQYPRFTEQ